MGAATDGKSFEASGRVPQAEGNRASGPWGAVLTSGEKERAGFGLPSSPSVKPGMWERGPCTLPRGMRAPPTPGQGSPLLPSRGWNQAMQKLC